jgi:Iap family predicted aminopeptidase
MDTYEDGAELCDVSCDGAAQVAVTYTHSPVNLVETLGLEIGVRQAGTAAAGRAAEAVADAFRDAGLDPRFHEFGLLGYEADEPELDIDGERWDAGPCIYSNPTGGTVEGRVRRLGTHSIGGFFPEADVFAVEDESGSELARLLMTPFGGPAIPFLTGARQIAVGPAVFISGEDAARLRKREGVLARVRVGGRFVPGLTERNVVAELRGQSEEAIVVSAHYDSVWRGPGVIDNATGVEGVRRIAENLAGHGHMRSLIFIAFAAEEIGCIGSRSWIFDSEVTGELERVKACVNLDCIAHGDRLELMASPKPLAARLEGFAGELGLGERYDLNIGPAGPGVDAFPFHEKGIPAATVSHFGYDEYHLPTERLELVDEQRLADSVEVATLLIESLLEQPVQPG